MHWNRRTIGLVLLLFAWSGDVAWDLGAEAEQDHKLLRTSALCTTATAGRFFARGVRPPRLRTEAGTFYAGTPGWPFSCSPSSPGTLLSLGCLLSV